jgi:hypothetical protein
VKIKVSKASAAYLSVADLIPHYRRCLIHLLKQTKKKSSSSDTMNNGMNNNNNNTYIGNFRVQQQNDNSTSPHQQMMNQMTDGFKPFYKKYEAKFFSLRCGESINHRLDLTRLLTSSPTVISSSATTTTCRLFENFSRNCPETTFKSHFDEVIILQLFITLASACECTSKVHP